MSQQLTLQPDATSGVDAYLTSGAYSNFNLGSTNLAFVGSTNGKSLVTYRTLLRFDLSAIPVGALITGTRLVLTKSSGTYVSGATFLAHRLTNEDWTELGVTWEVYDGVHPWLSAGGDYVAEAASTATLAADATQLTIESLAPLAADAIWFRQQKLQLLIRAAQTSDGYAVFYSSDEVNPAYRPQLIVDYVAAPSVQIVDHGDGSGATATIEGVESDRVATLYVRRFNGELGAAGDWSAVGSRVGEGDLELNLAAGHYLAHATVTTGGGQLISPVVYFVVTDGLEAIHARCLAAVQARLRLLVLDGVEDERIVVEKVPAGRNLGSELELPAVVISPERAAMPATAGTNGTDDVHYDVLITMIDRDNQEPTLAAQLDRLLLWRQQVAKAFRNQRLPGVPEVINSEVEPAEGLHDQAWKHELMVSALRLRFTSREARGF